MTSLRKGCIVLVARLNWSLFFQLFWAWLVLGSICLHWSWKAPMGSGQLRIHLHLHLPLRWIENVWFLLSIIASLANDVMCYSIVISCFFLFQGCNEFKTRPQSSLVYLLTARPLGGRFLLGLRFIFYYFLFQSCRWVDPYSYSAKCRTLRGTLQAFVHPPCK